ncbi:recombinase family protein [Sphingomonas sp. G-3-2-10]|uniref:recombinase family protein n=1 Tax=Sphingomonas sp. G-3-2-10 TaxID=2728838 RepID=UPI00146BDF91|nr:recombinase family protein [Sphingomonas sp. G-3-2-10]NML04297.1 recombinase family protein [Sphingomonas sp. G-3-2-10]
MPANAIVYARFSSSEQSKGYSLERQLTLGREFAAEQGWTVEATITDEGRSAYHGNNRLEGSSLHQFELEARNGLHRGKVLLVENVDRLSRQGPKAAARLIWGLNECGVDVATFHDGRIYGANESGELEDVLLLMMSAINAHQESDKKSKRVTASWRSRFDRIATGAKNLPMPNQPLWLDRVDGELVLNDHRVRVLNDIYDLYIDGVGIHKIVTILHAREEPSWTPPEQRRGNNGWFYSYIYRLLTKRTVLGEYVKHDGKTISTDFWPQAISTEKWNRAQAALAMRKGNQKTEKINLNRNLLQGIIVCEQCGGGAHFRHQIDKGQTYRRKSGELVTYKRNDHRRVRCDKARRKHDCDNGTILSYDVLEWTVLEEMLPKLVEKRSDNPAALELRQRIAELVRLREADQTRLSNLVDVLADGGSKAIVQRVGELEAAIERQDAEIAAAQKALAIESAKPASDDDVALIESLRAELNSPDDEIRSYARGRVNMSLRRLIKRIAITPTGLFRVEPDDQSWWLFDDTGKLLEGEAVIG